MTHKLTCTIPSSQISYDIEIRNGLLSEQKGLAHYLASLGSRFAIITNDRIAPLYGEPLCNSLSAAGLETFLFSFPSGEHYKTRATKERLEDQLLERGFGRDTCIIALGGGVVTDTVGYLAATYCRGVPLVLIPTSLLGMVDASIGGKTGVDTIYGKNMIGCTYQPKRVFIDPSTLQGLPPKELANGVVEMIKHGLITDHRFFEYLETHVDQILALDPAVIEQVIFESCRIKKGIVEDDEKGHGKRNLLNFGHTVGHALEKLTNYTLSHGEAVAIGLLVESHLAIQLGVFDQNSYDRIYNILVKYGLPLKLPSRLSPQAILDAMSLDKKSLKGKPRFVIINKIGSCLPYDSNYCTQVDETLINNIPNVFQKWAF